MNIQQLHDKIKIYRLFELGHFYNPQFKNGFNITEVDLDVLTLDDKVVKDAIHSFQDMMIYDFERLSFKFHNRGASCDGDCCEATQALFEVQRCSFPDYTLNTKVGSGSWPEPCQKAGITYSYNSKGVPNKFASSFENIIIPHVVQAYRKIGANLVKYTGSGKANIDIYFRSFGGSTIGMAEFNSESCGDNVFCSISNSFSPNEPTEADLLKHEIGHNMNLSHTRGGVMNPSIINQTEFLDWQTNDPSYNTLVRYFGGEPVGPVPPPPLDIKVELLNTIPNVDKIQIDFKQGILKTYLNNIQNDTYSILNNKIL